MEIPNFTQQDVEIMQAQEISNLKQKVIKEETELLLLKLKEGILEILELQKHYVGNCNLQCKFCLEIVKK